MKATVATAPVKEAASRKGSQGTRAWSPRAVTAKAPSAAPPETPRMYGSASGFRRIAWKTAPAAPRAAPVMAASRMRGSRTRRIIAAAVAASPWPAALPGPPEAGPGGSRSRSVKPLLPRLEQTAIAAARAASRRPIDTAMRLEVKGGMGGAILAQT